MQRPPRGPHEPLLTRRLLWRVGYVSVLFVAGAFGIFFYAIERGYSVELARTMVVNTLVVMEIFYLFNVRYIHGPSVTWQGVLGTPAVLISLSAVVLAQLAFTYVPFMQVVFKTEPITIRDGALILGIGVAVLIAVEMEKRLVGVVSSPGPA
jgi:magnesium-transporting ATPase (P-type)